MPACDRCRQSADPSPEEIADLAAVIRESWSEREHWLRAGLNPDVDLHWNLPRVRSGVAVPVDAV